MSEPLRAIFSPEHTIFRKECQCKIKIKIKILNFCLGYFDKINLSKCDIFFSNLSCYAKTGSKKDNFFQILDSKKDKYMFQKAHERIKDCLLIYHFL